jgi:hypothetical protein
MCQSARDGAATVNYLQEFYETAYQRPAPVLRRCISRSHATSRSPMSGYTGVRMSTGPPPRRTT